MRTKVGWLLYLEPTQSLRGCVNAHDGQAGIVGCEDRLWVLHGQCGQRTHVATGEPSSAAAYSADERTSKGLSPPV